MAKEKSYRQLAKDWGDNTNIGWIKKDCSIRTAIMVFGEYLDRRKYKEKLLKAIKH
jgi:hypothetical protein